MSSWRCDFAGGLAVLVPLIVILYILTSSYNGIMSIPYAVTALSTDGAVVPLSEALGFTISVIIFLLLVLSVGCLMRTTANCLLEPDLSAAMNEIPFVRIVYNASKLAVGTTLTGIEDLQKPARLETWPSIRMTAFRTGKATRDGKVIVFISTAPNITTGSVMKVDLEDIEEADEKVGKALTRVLSAGLAEQDHVDEFNIEVAEESSDGRVPSNE